MNATITAKILTQLSEGLTKNQQIRVTFIVRSPKKWVKVPERHRLVISSATDPHFLRYEVFCEEKMGILHLKESSQFPRGEHESLAHLLADYGVRIMDVSGKAIEFVD